MTRIAASSQGESRLRMLRVVRRGDRHDPRDLTISLQFEGTPDAAFSEGQPTGLLPGETIKNLVHTTVCRHGAREIEELGLALAAQCLERQPMITRARVEIAEARWQRLDAGGRAQAQAQAFVAGSSEQRIAVVTSNGQQTAVVGGISGLTVMRSAGFYRRRRGEDPHEGLQPLLIGTLGVRWTYTSGDVTFAVHRQGLRAAVLDSFAWHESRSVQHALHATAEVLLSTYDDIAAVTLAFHERPYRPADLFASGTENPDELFVVIEEPVGVVEVTVERQP